MDLENVKSEIWLALSHSNMALNGLDWSNDKDLTLIDGWYSVSPLLSFSHVLGSVLER